MSLQWNYWQHDWRWYFMMSGSCSSWVARFKEISLIQPQFPDILFLSHKSSYTTLFNFGNLRNVFGIKTIILSLLLIDKAGWTAKSKILLGHCQWEIPLEKCQDCINIQIKVRLYWMIWINRWMHRQLRVTWPHVIVVKWKPPCTGVGTCVNMCHVNSAVKSSAMSFWVSHSRVTWVHILDSEMNPWHVPA